MKTVVFFISFKKKKLKFVKGVFDACIGFFCFLFFLKKRKGKEEEAVGERGKE